MGSADWLNVNGLKVKKLGFYDLLGKVAFRHCDGVVNVKRAPAPTDHKTDAVSRILGLFRAAGYHYVRSRVKWRCRRS